MVLSLGVFLILFTTFLYLLHYVVRGGRKGELIDKIPGPYAWPFIGNIGMFMVCPEELWNLSRKLNKEYYPINRIWSVKVPVINVYHPDDVEALLSNIKHIEKSLLYNFLHPWLNAGLLTSKGEKWHDRRKILTPAFHFNVLRQFVPIFVEQSEKLVKSICLESDEKVYDIVPLLHNFTLNSICETAMGTSFDQEHDVKDEYRSCVSRMGGITLHRLTRPWLHMDWSFKWSQMFKDQVEALKVLHGFSTKIIKERKQYHEETGGRYLKGLGFETGSNVYGFEGEGFVKGKRRLAMLDLLISASKQNANIDDEGIREEVDTFIFEGHDTTAMALAFTLLLLAENKEAQDKARAEVDDKFDESEEGKLTLKDIQSLVYLERCIKESLRLFPSVPFISRHVSEELRLSAIICK
ncbi:cytochrome P450 4C1-like isoform X2 [Athalia rosae]|uniref:cytochrome P450 4C1-like isoform X2 n=1 Tax=Athalia rosae TaxID=37344 RepID=UPI0020339990|nr:cytochrome P450 4C1-like isoform X2 [Athalia rosae]